MKHGRSDQDLIGHLHWLDFVPNLFLCCELFHSVIGCAEKILDIKSLAFLNNNTTDIFFYKGKTNWTEQKKLKFTKTAQMFCYD